MKLLWHIARKDLCRLARPAAAWLVFQAVAAQWVATAAWSPVTVDLFGAADWMRTLRGAALVGGWIGLSAAVLLAGVLVLEDHAVGSAAFWRTRPIGPWRLLGAKLLTATLMLVVAPVVVLVPIWLVAGFSRAELGQTVLATLAANTWVAVVAMGVAGLTANLGQHAFAVLVLASSALLSAVALPAMVMPEGASVEALESQAWLIAALVALAAVATLCCQYFTRRTALGWGIWVAALVGIATVRIGWPWEVTGAGPGREPTPAEAGAQVTWHGPVRSAEFHHGTRFMVAVEASEGGREFLAPVSGRGSVRGGANSWTTLELGLGEDWARDAVRRVAGVSPGRGLVNWEMVVRQRHGWAGGKTAEALRFSGQLEFARLRGTVLYELPVRPGATAQRGGARTRLVGHVEGAAGIMLVEDRGVALPSVGVVSRLRRVERFVLVHRASGAVRDVKAMGQVGAGLHGLNRNVLTLTPEPAGEFGADGWTLVKVRLEPVGWWVHELTDVANSEGARAQEGGS